jgi:hypothetical protein
MPFSPYASKLLPTGFRYPSAYLEFAESAAPDALYPWWFIDADSKAGELSWAVSQRSKRSLIPFAKTDEHDDIACFDGDDTSGNPRILMRTSTPDRSYHFESFTHWLRKAQQDAGNFGLLATHDAATKKMLCSVIAMLDSSSCQVAGLELASTRIPIAAVPLDLRRPNAEFWILRHGDLFQIFRNEQDHEPAGTGSWAQIGA